MQTVEKAVDGRGICRRIMLKNVFLSHRPQSPRQVLSVERPRVARTGQRPPGSGKHQFIDLFRGQAQGCFKSKTKLYAITLQSPNRGSFSRSWR